MNASAYLHSCCSSAPTEPLYRDCLYLFTHLPPPDPSRTAARRAGRWPRVILCAGVSPACCNATKLVPFIIGTFFVYSCLQLSTGARRSNEERCWRRKSDDISLRSLNMLQSHSQNAYEDAPPSPDLWLEAICRAHASLVRPDRKGRKVFETLDEAWLRQPVSIHVQLPDKSIDQSDTELSLAPSRQGSHLPIHSHSKSLSNEHSRC